MELASSAKAIATTMMDHEFSSLEVADLTGVSLRQLQWWDEQGVVRPVQKGHRRLYNVYEVVRVSVITGLRKKGMSLQRIRGVLAKLDESRNGYFLELHRRGPDVFLLTNGESVYVETATERIIEILKDSSLPIIALCISDMIRQLGLELGAPRKPVRNATSSTGRRRAARVARPERPAVGE